MAWVRGARGQYTETLREAVFAISLRATPGLRGFRNSTICHMVLRNLHDLHKSGRSGTLRNLATRKGPGSHISLRHADVIAALEQLRDAALISLTGNLRHPKTVTAEMRDTGFSLLREEDSQRDALLKRVLARVLSNVEGDTQSWEFAFIDVLGRIFSLLGREYVAVLVGRKMPREVIREALLRDTCTRSARRFGLPNADLLFTRVARFFEEQNPDSSKIIWHFAQGYFALCELSSGIGDEALSEELLAGKTFLLDTNVLFPMAIEGMPRHSGMKKFAQACSRLGGRVAVTRPTLDEFSSSLCRQVEQARDLLPRLPGALVEQLRDPVYHAYLNHIESNPGSGLDDALSSLANPRSLVRSIDGVSVVDDRWFADIENSSNLRRMVEEVRNVSRELRGKAKTWNIAKHDAKLLMFVAHERERGEDCLVVSLDSVLPSCAQDDGQEQPVVVLLDALLQWVCPGLEGVANEDELAEIFASALYTRLFPWEDNLQLQHLSLLDQIGQDCFALPEEDLLDCVRHLRKILPMIDPTSDSGQNRLIGELQLFLATPGRRYQREILAERERRTGLERRLTSIGKRDRAIVKTSLSALVVGASLFLGSRYGSGDAILDRLSSWQSLLGILAFGPWLADWLMTRHR